MSDILVATEEDVSRLAHNWNVVPDMISDADAVMPVTWVEMIYNEGTRRKHELGVEGKGQVFQWPEPFCGERGGQFCEECLSKLKLTFEEAQKKGQSLLKQGCGRRVQFYYADANRPEVAWNYSIWMDWSEEDVRSVQAGFPKRSWEFQTHVSFKDRMQKTLPDGRVVRDYQEFSECEVPADDKGKWSTVSRTGGRAINLPQVDDSYLREIHKRIAGDFVTRKIPEMCRRFTPPVVFDYQVYRRPFPKVMDKNAGYDHEMWRVIMNTR